jgi:hypothetical protein
MRGGAGFGMGMYQVHVIAFLWASAVLVSCNSALPLSFDPSTQWSALLAAVCAVVLLARTDSLRLLQLSIFFYLVSALLMMPAIPNHRVVLAMAGLAILAGTFQSKSLSTKVVANLRWLTIVVYFFAVLAKCNYDYLRADVSCASNFLQEALKLHDISPANNAAVPNAPSLVGYWSLFVEIFIALLLLPVRTRGFAILLGILFHICLAAHYTKYFANFSSAMFLLLGSWLSEEQSRRLEACSLSQRRGLFVLWALLLNGALVAGAVGVLDVQSWIIIRYVSWLIFSIFVLAVIARTLLAVPYNRADARLGAPHVLLVVIAIANGLSPYLGIKTRSGFSMYSNLRIEPQYSNHLFMPVSPDLLGYLSDTVRVIEPANASLQSQSESLTQRLPYIMLCEYVAGMDGTRTKIREVVSYERNGQNHRLERGGELPADCPPWIARKFLLFGPVGAGSERLCIW